MIKNSCYHMRQLHLQLATLTLEAEQAYLAIQYLLRGESVWVSWQYQEAIISVVGSEHKTKET